MANKEMMINQTVDLSLRSFMILGPEDIANENILRIVYRYMLVRFGFHSCYLILT